MELPSYFSEFLHKIRPCMKDRTAFRNSHIRLRTLLEQDSRLSHVIVTTFLQGSYRRSTAIRAYKGSRPDVDVVVVTRLDQNEYQPADALQVFKPFLRTYYAGNWGTNERSLWITDPSYDVDLDLVITSAPSEAEIGVITGVGWNPHSTVEEEEHDSNTDHLWKLSPLQIPDRQAERWEPTHPMAQLAWTRDKNRMTGGNYVNVVKALKWWRRIFPGMPKHPKGYPFERLIDRCCPSEIKSVSVGIATVLTNMVRNYRSYAELGLVPFLPNHGIPTRNVLTRVPPNDFRIFINKAQEAADIAQRALEKSSVRESSALWRQLFGELFPAASLGVSERVSHR